MTRLDAYSASKRLEDAFRNLTSIVDAMTEPISPSSGSPARPAGGRLAAEDSQGGRIETLKDVLGAVKREQEWLASQSSLDIKTLRGRWDGWVTELKKYESRPDFHRLGPDNRAEVELIENRLTGFDYKKGSIQERAL
jgi:hypothetical protein